MRIYTAVLIAFIVSTSPQNLLACSCAFVGIDGFIGQSKGLALSKDGSPATKLLPRNARGVLYLNTRSGAWRAHHSLPAYFVNAVPPAVSAEHFSAQDVTTDLAIEFSVRKLQTGLDAERSYYAFKDEQIKSCLYQGGLGKHCKTLNSGRDQDPKKWFAGLLEQKLIFDVTDKMEKSIGLFRLEPKEGFTADHTYTFSSLSGNSGPQYAYDSANPTLPGGSITVQISKETLKAPLTEEISMSLEGGVTPTLLSIPAGGSCSQNILASVQNLQYQIPQSLLPYKESLLFFTMYGKSADKLERWHYQPGLCATVSFGRSAVGYAKELIYARCMQTQHSNSKILPEISYLIQGRYGFLEVEDTLRKTSTYNIRFPAGDENSCRQDTFLSGVLESKNRDEIKKQICRFSGQFGTSFGNTSPDFIKTLVKHTKNSDVEIRRCAIQSFPDLEYKFQNSKDSKILQAIREDVTPAIAYRLIEDSDQIVRQLAAKSLKSILALHRLQSLLSPKQIAALFPVLKKGLLSKDKTIRSNAAGSLIMLGPQAKEVADVLILAIRDTTKPTYQMPTALAEIAPDHVDTIPTLIDALENPDSTLRGTAATALAKVGTNKARSIPALIEAAQNGNSNAVKALGQFGSAAISAAPMLVSIAKDSKWEHLRSSAMKSLVAIGADEKIVLKLLLAHLNSSENTYSKSSAIDLIGTLKPAPALVKADLIKFLEGTPSDSDVISLLRTFEKIGLSATDVEDSAVKLLDHSAEYIRTAAGKYLIKSFSTDDALVSKLLRNSSQGVRRVALESLQNKPLPSPSTSVLKALVRIIRDEDQSDDEVRRAVSAAIRLEGSSPILCEALKVRIELTDNRWNREPYEEIAQKNCSS